MPKQFDNTDRGGLWPRDKKGANHPDMGGEFILSEKTVRYLVECLKVGKEAKLDVSAWSKTPRSGARFLSCSVQIPYADRQGVQPAVKEGFGGGPKEQSGEKSYAEEIKDTPPWDSGGDPLPKVDAAPWE